MDKTQTIYLLVFRNKDMSSFPEKLCDLALWRSIKIMPICVPLFLSIKTKYVTYARLESVENFALDFSIVLDTRCRSEIRLWLLVSDFELFLNSGFILAISYYSGNPDNFMNKFVILGSG